jgi:transcriptional regulator with XRE-family HTH domain
MSIMASVLEYLTGALKKAREDKKLSQRALSRRVGMTQAQISRIEQSSVDLRTSTLIELARALDLEVVLVPRKYLPAVKALTSPASSNREAVGDAPRPAYFLPDEKAEDG